MPTIQGITFPDIVTGKTPGAAVLAIFSGSGEELTKTYNICQFSFLSNHAIVTLKDKDGLILKENGKLVYKTLVVKNPKFSIHGQKPVSLP